MAYVGPFPLPVKAGGTGDLTLTVNGVLIGETTSAIVATAAGTNGQVLIGATGSAPAFATLTSTGATITFTTGANSLNLEATGGSGTTSFVTSSGTATPSSGVIDIIQGLNTLTSGATNVVTIGEPLFRLANNYTALTHSSSPYTVLANDYYLSSDTTAGVLTINLPNAPTTNRLFIIKDRTGQAATNAITVTTVGGSVTIDGSTSYVMSVNYQSISLIFNGTSYEIF